MSLQKSLLRSLPILATVLGKRYGVEVVMGAQIPCTNGKQIFLPQLPPDDFDAAAVLGNGFIDHEAAHVRETDMEVFKKFAEQGPFYKGVLNILEDIRIEQRQGNMYPGSRSNFHRLTQKLVKDKFWTAPKANDHPGGIVQDYLLYKLRLKVLGQDAFEKLEKQSDNVARQVLPSKMLNALDQAMDGVKNLKNTVQAKELAEKIVKLVIDGCQMPAMPGDGQSDGVGDEDGNNSSSSSSGNSGKGKSRKSSPNKSKNPGKQNSSGGQDGSNGSNEEDKSEGDDSSGAEDKDGTPQPGKSGKSSKKGDKQGAGSDGDTGGASDKEDENEGDDKPGAVNNGGNDSGGQDGSSQQQNGSNSGQPNSGRQKGQKAQGKQPGPGKASGKNSGEPMPGQYGDTSEHELGELLEKILNASDDDLSSDIGKMIADALQKLSQKSPDSPLPSTPAVPDSMNGSKILEVAHAQNRALMTRFQGYFQAMTRAERWNVYSSSRLDTRRLDRCWDPNAKMCVRKIDKDLPNAAIHILIDISGSMHSKIDVAIPAGLAITMALQSVKGLAVACTAFPYRFDSQCATLVRFGEDARRCAGRFAGVGSNGNTPMAEALWYVAQTLVPREEKRKVIIVLTDGAPNEPAEFTEKAIELLDGAGVEIYGVGVMCDAVRKFFKNFTHVQSMQELAPKVFDMLGKAVIYQKRQADKLQGSRLKSVVSSR
jgi:cobaltochelatase CobT